MRYKKLPETRYFSYQSRRREPFDITFSDPFLNQSPVRRNTVFLSIHADVVEAMKLFNEPAISMGELGEEVSLALAAKRPIGGFLFHS